MRKRPLRSRALSLIDDKSRGVADSGLKMAEGGGFPNKSAQIKKRPENRAAFHNSVCKWEDRTLISERYSGSSV